MEAFGRVEVHRLREGEKVVEVFQKPLTEIQRDVLRLAGVPEEAYSPQAKKRGKFRHSSFCRCGM